MKRLSFLSVASALALSAPLLASAQTGINIHAIEPYSNGIINVINGILLPVLIALAFIVFLFGIYKYFILGAANESEKGEGRKFAMWGIIGFVVLFSVWGIVRLVMNTAGLSAGTTPPPPTFNTGGASNTQTQNANSQTTYPIVPATGGGSNTQTNNTPYTQYESCIAADYNAEYCAAEYPDSAPAGSSAGGGTNNNSGGTSATQQDLDAWGARSNQGGGSTSNAPLTQYESCVDAGYPAEYCAAEYGDN